MRMPSSSSRSSTGSKQQTVGQSITRFMRPMRTSSQGLLLRIFRRLERPRPYSTRIAATENQRNLVLTGLMLGFFSLFASILPPCGFAISITGLLIGLYGRRATPLHTMASWAIALAFFGLVLSTISSIFTLGIFVRYLFS